MIVNNSIIEKKFLTVPTTMSVWANPTVMVIQQWSKQRFHPHHTGGVSPPWTHPLGFFFFFLQIYWENAKFQCKKKGLFTHIVT